MHSHLHRMVQTHWFSLSLALLVRVLPPVFSFSRRTIIGLSLLHSLTATCSALTKKKVLALLLDLEFGRVVHSHLHRMVQTHWFSFSLALLVRVLALVFSLSRRTIIRLSLLHSLTATCSALTKKKALALLLDFEFGRVVHSHLHRMVHTHWFSLSLALLVRVLTLVFSFSRRTIGHLLLHSLTATCRQRVK